MKYLFSFLTFLTSIERLREGYILVSMLFICFSCSEVLSTMKGGELSPFLFPAMTCSPATAPNKLASFDGLLTSKTWVVAAMGVEEAGRRCVAWLFMGRELLVE